MNVNIPSKVPVVAESVLDSIEERILQSKVYELSDEDLLCLHSVYGSVFERSLDILEKYPTLETYSTANKVRVLIEIKGEKDQFYRVFPKINFCPCRAFKHQVIEKRVQITCKHVLAGRIAVLLGKTVDREVTQEQYLMLVRSIIEPDQNG